MRRLARSLHPSLDRETGGYIASSPAVSKGVVSLTSHDGRLYAFDAKGKKGCTGAPRVCNPLWTSTTSSLGAGLAVGEDLTYVTSQDGRLYAFDARGRKACTGTPVTCRPLWTTSAGLHLSSAPIVANDVVYAAGTQLYAFDGKGNKRCAGLPRACEALWTSPPGVHGADAVSNGLVYAGGQDPNTVPDALFVFGLP